MSGKIRLLRITTAPISLVLLLKGQLTHLKAHGFDVLAASADGPECSTIKREGIAHEVVPMSRRITPVRDLVCLLKLVLLIRRYRPHIVHTHTPKAGFLGMMASFICRAPVRIHTVAGLPLMEARGVRQRILWFVERLTYACANRVYINSPGLKTIIEDELGPSPKFAVLGRGSTNGIDTDYFIRTPELSAQAAEIRKEYKVDPREVVFSFVGRVVRDKGINELLEAFDKLSREIPARLVLIGPFENHLDPISNESMATLKSNKGIICPGYQDDVRPWLLASDVFVFPSYREGFPNSVMQASCLGRPCIVTNINGSNELITNGLNGLVVPVKSVPALYAAMSQLARSPEMREAMGSKSRESIVLNFSQTYIWNCLIDEYRKLLEHCMPNS